MQLPGGRILDSGFGGEDAIKRFFNSMAEGVLDGFLKISLFSDSSSSEGYVVFHKGKPVLAEHTGDEHVLGDEAFEPIVRDALASQSVLELHTYSYKSSSIVTSHVLRDNKEASLSYTPDLISTLDSIKRSEDAKRVMGDELKRRKREMESRMDTREKELMEREWALREDGERRSESAEVRRLREELDGLRQTSAALLKHVADGSIPDEDDIMALAERRAEQMRLKEEQARLETEKGLLEKRRQELDDKFHDVEKREVFLRQKERSVSEEAERLDKERRELDSLWKDMEEKSKKSLEIRKDMEKKVQDQLDREKALLAREDELRRRERELQKRDKDVAGQEANLVLEQRSVEARRRAISDMEEELKRKDAKLAESEGVLVEKKASLEA